MRLLAILLTLTNIAQAKVQKTYICQMEGFKGSFRIVENSPQPGSATIESTGNKSILRFTETSEVRKTRYGILTVTKKVYFHPYYEYQLFLIKGAEYYLPNVENLKGRYLSEMNSAKIFRCVERK